MRIRSAVHLALPALVVAVSLPGTPTTPSPDDTTFEVALTKRSSLVRPNGVVNLSLLKSHISFIEAKYDSRVEDFESNTGEVHPISSLLPASNTRKRAGSIALQSKAQVMWTGTIQVGNPPRSYEVDFDTGSADTILPAIGCGSACAGLTLYNSTNSTTSVDLKKSFSLGYQDGTTTSGKQYSDTVRFAGNTALAQTIGGVTSMTPGFFGAMNGIVGLAFQEISHYKAPPLLQNMHAQNPSKFAHVFGLKLTQRDSSIMFGGSNKKLFEGLPTWTPLIFPGFWEIQIGAVKVGGKEIKTSNKFAIVDSGTSLIAAPRDFVTSFYARVPGSKDIGGGLYSGKFPCNNIPRMSITIAGKTISIDPETFTIGLVAAGSKDCVAGVQYLPSASLWILGDVFMQNTYTIFDGKNNRVGFADLA